MPKYEAIIGGKPRQIELNRTSPDSFTAKIDGKTRQIKLKQDGNSVEKTLLDIDGKPYEIELAKAELGSKFSVRVEEAAFDVEVKAVHKEDALSSFAPAMQVPSKKAGANKMQTVEGAVTAPMTGKIIKIKVKKNEQVKAGQILCVVEAMKMENEICAPKAGTIAEVNVEEGTAVNEGDPLFIIC